MLEFFNPNPCLWNAEFVLRLEGKNVFVVDLGVLQCVSWGVGGFGVFFEGDGWIF